jgi:oligopeptide transport system substrate-binding protein
MDPATFLEMYTTASGQNRTGWSNPRYDELIDAAGCEADNARRFELLAEAERILCEEEIPIIPLYFRTGNLLLKPRFTGLRDNIREVLPIHRVRLRDDSSGGPAGAAQ